MNNYQQSHFPLTRWTRVIRAVDHSDPSAARKAFEEICTDYREVLVRFLRTCNAGDRAEDLVQELFHRLTRELFPLHNPGQPLPETDRMPIGMRTRNANSTPLLVLAKEVEGCTRLRYFFMHQVKAILHTTLRSEYRASASGSVVSVADVADAEHEAIDKADSALHLLPPDEAFDAAWRIRLIEKARVALRATWAINGRADRFDILYPMLDRMDNAEKVAAAISEVEAKPLTPEGAKTALHRMKLGMRDKIEEEIRETVDSEEAFEEEYRHLFR